MYLHPDLLGSPRKASSGTGALLWQEHYDPYGAKLNGSETTVGYTGHAHDATGLTYMKARFYDPSQHRFLTPDPIHFVDDNPFTFNRYAYGNNNPYKYNDPDGRLPNFVIGAAVGAGIEAGAQLLVQGRTFSELDWTDIGIAAAVGSVTGVVGAASAKAAVQGLISGSVAVERTAAAGAIAGGLGQIAEDAANGESSSPEAVGLSTLAGGVGSAAGARLANAAVFGLESMAAKGGVLAGLAGATQGSFSGNGAAAATSAAQELGAGGADLAAGLSQKVVEKDLNMK